MVQIHSPRPLFYNQQLTRIVAERLVADHALDASNLFGPGRIL
jgi:hypothetical protein